MTMHKAILLLATMVCCPDLMAAVCLVRDGEPLAHVVVAATASDQVRDAARLLVACVRQSTGAELPLLDREPDGGGVTVFVGRSSGTAALAIDQHGLDDDGFEILFPAADTVVILGPTDWGTEFGVCEFLERYVGVRWLLPGPAGTDIPAHEDLVFEPEPVRDEPAFLSRLFSGQRGSVQAAWARRNRMHGRIKFHHNLIQLFPPDSFTEPHPEFFPLRDGTRFLPATNSTHHWQPCFTAADLTGVAVSRISAHFAGNPAATSYSLGANDSSGYCTCARCLARIPGDKNFLGRVDYSDLYYAWANGVIDRVLVSHPEKYFGCLAYSEVAAPPREVNVHPRLIPYMTYDRMKWVDPELRATGEALTTSWHEKSPVLGWYDYIYGTPYVLPRVWFHHMADYYRFGHDHGVRALYAEAYPNWGEGPKLYISLKLQWDPRQDVDALLSEWYERCVGPEAAPYLADYYAHWEDFWTRRVLESSWFTTGGQYLRFSDPGYLRDVSLEEIKQSRSLLEAAVAKAKTDAHKARAQLLLDAFEYYEATAYAFKAYGTDAVQTIRTPEDAIKLIDASVATARYGKRRSELALDIFPSDPVLVHPIPITRFSLLAGNSWGGGVLWRAYDVVAGADGPVRQRLRELAEHCESQTVRDHAQMMLRLSAGKLAHLTNNPSFETGTDSKAQNWSWWVKFGVGAMRRSADVAHTGKYSVLCDGMRRGGPVQTLDIRSGRYVLVCFVYVPDGQRVGGTVELSMTLRNAAGKNLTSPSTKIVPQPGRWTAVATGGAVPEKIGEDTVTSVLPILIVDGFEPGERAYVDDVMLSRLGD